MRGISINDIVVTQDGKHTGKIVDIQTRYSTEGNPEGIDVTIKKSNGMELVFDIEDIVIV